MLSSQCEIKVPEYVTSPARIRSDISMEVSGQIESSQERTTTIAIETRCSNRNHGFLIHDHVRALPTNIKTRPNTLKITTSTCRNIIASATSMSGVGEFIDALKTRVSFMRLFDSKSG